MRLTPFGSDHESPEQRSRQLLTDGPSLNVVVSRLRSTRTNELAPTHHVARRNALALIDSGASVNCIDVGLAGRIGLLEVDTRAIASASGLGPAPVYLARLEVPELDFTLTGELFGARLAQQNRGHRLLLGRRFLQNFIFQYDSLDGRFYLGRPDYASPSDMA